MGCEGTHGVFPRCDLACTPCYHSRDANRVRVDGAHTVPRSTAQMALLRGCAGPAERAAHRRRGHAASPTTTPRRCSYAAARAQADEHVARGLRLLVPALARVGPDGAALRALSFAGHFDSMMFGFVTVPSYCSPGTADGVFPDVQTVLWCTGSGPDFGFLDVPGRSTPTGMQSTVAGSHRSTDSVSSGDCDFEYLRGVVDHPRPYRGRALPAPASHLRANPGRGGYACTLVGVAPLLVCLLRQGACPNNVEVQATAVPAPGRTGRAPGMTMRRAADRFRSTGHGVGGGRQVACR